MFNCLNHIILFIIISGAFTKLRKATVSFDMSVRPSVRIKQLSSYWTDCNKI